jgi:N-carbamoylputrescine amidase
MALMGAELLLYPTAIGSEPLDVDVDSKDHWQMCMRGHAAANLMPVVASNRIGREAQGNSAICFYGSSFIAGPRGELIQQADRETEAVLTHTFDLDQLAFQRDEWGVFRDRRPELYGPLMTMDGRQKRGT